MEKRRLEGTYGRFIGSEMPTQCQYCRYNPEGCKKTKKLFSKRNGFELCPDRIDIFKIDFPDYEDGIRDILLHNDIDTDKKWEYPYNTSITIYLEGIEIDNKLIFSVKYHDEFIRDEPEEQFIDEISDLIHNVFTNTIDETSLKDALCNH